MLARKQAKRARKAKARRVREAEAWRAAAKLRPQPPPPPPKGQPTRWVSHHRNIVKKSRPQNRKSSGEPKASHQLDAQVIQAGNKTSYAMQTPVSGAFPSLPALRMAQAMPEILLLIACPFPPKEASHLRVTTAEGLAKRLKDSSKLLRIITPRDVLIGDDEDNNDVISGLIYGESDMLTRLCISIREQAMRHLARVEGSRVLLCGFYTFGLKQIAALKKAFSGAATTSPMHLGIVSLYSSRNRLAKKMALALAPQYKANREECVRDAERRIASFDAQCDPIINSFGGKGSQSVLTVSQMQKEESCAMEILLRLSGGSGSLNLEQTKLQVTNIATYIDRETQTDDPTVTMQQREEGTNSRILLVSSLGNGHLPLPASALLEASSSSKFSCSWQRNKLDFLPVSQSVDGVVPSKVDTDSSNPLHNDHGTDKVTSMNDAAMQQLLGWFAMLSLSSEVGHPDDWDRTFSNGYLIAKILCAADKKLQKLIVPEKNMRTAFSSAAKSHNWKWIEGVLSRVQGITPNITRSLSKALPGSAIRMLAKLYRYFNKGALLGTRVPGAAGIARLPNATLIRNSLWEREQKRMLLQTGRMEAQVES